MHIYKYMFRGIGIIATDANIQNFHLWYISKVYFSYLFPFVLYTKDEYISKEG